MKHFHKCGFTGRPGGTEGCGLIYQHDEKDFHPLDSERAHTCPRCGRKSSVEIDGHTYTQKYHPQTCVQAGEKYEHPDERTCPTWPPIPAGDEEGADSPTYANSWNYEEFIQDLQRAYLCLVRVSGKSRFF